MDHLLDVDLAAVLADPSTAKLDTDGPAAQFLTALAGHLPGDGPDHTVQVVVRTTPPPGKRHPWEEDSHQEGDPEIKWQQARPA